VYSEGKGNIDMSDHSAEPPQKRDLVVGQKLVINQVGGFTQHVLVDPLQPKTVVRPLEGMRALITIRQLSRERCRLLDELPREAHATFQVDSTETPPYQEGFRFDDLPGVHVPLQRLAVWTAIWVKAIPHARAAVDPVQPAPATNADRSLVAA
jgi:hypothetical protein